MTALIGDWETLTYRELQEVLRNEKDGGSDVRCKLNATKDDLMYECDRLIDSGNTVADRFCPIEDETLRLVADKQNFEQLTAQAESLAAVAESAEIAVFDEVTTPQNFDNYLTDMEDFLDRAIEAQSVNDRAAELPETKVAFTPHPLSNFEGIEAEVLGDWWLSTPLTCDPCNYQSVLIPTIPQPLQYLQEFFGDELPFTNEVWDSEPFTLDTVPTFEANHDHVDEWEVAEFYGAIFENSEITSPTPAILPNHGTTGLTLIVLFLQALQLLITVAIPLVIQVGTIGRKTFDAVVLALQSEPMLRLVDAS